MSLLGDYDTLQLHFRFYRYLALFFLRDFFPCILIVVLSWMTFWIDYGSTPARVAMGITTVLTIVTMTNNIRNHSPPAGLFRSIDYYLLMCNLFVFAALLEYALVGLIPNKANVKRSRNEMDAKVFSSTIFQDFFVYNSITRPCIASKKIFSLFSLFLLIFIAFCNSVLLY